MYRLPKDLPAFYSPITSGIGMVVLSEEETKHCKVLRLAEGNNILVLNGKGKAFHGRIAKTGKREALVEITDLLAEAKGADRKSILYLAPTKNTARLEWLLEKAVELGLHKLQFIETKRGERARVNLDRLEKITISALKQSRNLWLTEIAGPISFQKALETASHEKKYIAHCMKGEKIALQGLPFDHATEMAFLIGPEGDFTAEEVELATAKGWEPLNLGTNRLRTETAALLTIAGFYMHT